MMPDPSKQFRVGIVGAGYVSEFHIKALRRLPHVRIVGICDLHEASAKATAQRFGISSHASLKAMAGEGLDVVHVLTPPRCHVEVALEALSLGCHETRSLELASSASTQRALSGYCSASRRNRLSCVRKDLSMKIPVRISSRRSSRVCRLLSPDRLRRWSK